MIVGSRHMFKLPTESVLEIVVKRLKFGHMASVTRLLGSENHQYSNLSRPRIFSTQIRGIMITLNKNPSYGSGERQFMIVVNVIQPAAYTKHSMAAAES